MAFKEEKNGDTIFSLSVAHIPYIKYNVIVSYVGLSGEDRIKGYV